MLFCVGWLFTKPPHLPTPIFYSRLGVQLNCPAQIKTHAQSNIILELRSCLSFVTVCPDPSCLIMTLISRHQPDELAPSFIAGDTPWPKIDLLWETRVKASHAPHIYYAAVAWNLIAFACIVLWFTMEQIPWLFRWGLSCSSAAVSSFQSYPIRSCFVYSFEWLSLRAIKISSKGIEVWESICLAVRGLKNLALFICKSVSAWILELQVK